MRPETLLAKFNLKGINYEAMQAAGGKGLLALDEQLAAVGVTWKESPVGFLVLFVECLDDQESAKVLYKAVQAETYRLMANWRGHKSEKAIHALCITAIHEAVNPMGRICPECKGSGMVRDNHKHIRKCSHCNAGRIEWDCETRFAVFCSTGIAITYSRFKKYHKVLEQLNTWLAAKRTAAMLALMDRIEKEEAEARGEVA